jgi:MFS family permease
MAITNDYKKRLARNPHLYYIVGFMVNMEFNIPIWVGFYSRYLNFTQIALLNAWDYIVSVLLEVPTGALADLIGRKKTIMLGWVLIGIGNLCIAFLSHFPSFLILFTIRSLGSTLISGADTSIIYDSYKELGKEKDFIKYSANLGLMRRIALSIASFCGASLYFIDFRLPYILFGILQLTSLIFSSQLTEPDIKPKPFSIKNYINQTKDGFSELFKSSIMKKVTLYYMLIGGIGWSCVAYFNQPFAKDVGFSDSQMSILFGSVYLISATVILIAVRLKKMFTREIIYIGLPLILLLALIPGFMKIKLLGIITVIISTLVAGSRFTFLDQYVNLEFESKHRATAMSSLNMLVSIFVAITIGVGGIFQDLFKTPIIITVFGIISLIFILPKGIELARIHKE